MRELLARFRTIIQAAPERGAVSVEYVLLVAAIAAAIIAGVAILGPKITSALGALL